MFPGGVARLRGVVLCVGSARLGASADAVIVALAAAQKAVVTHAQLLERGVSRHEIATRLADGRLRELHRGVYLVGPVAPLYAMEQAALFACGGVAALSHLTAAALWRLIELNRLPGIPALTIPRGKRVRRSRVEIHRLPLDARDTRRLHGMPLTSPPRTVLDMAAVLGDPYELEALVAEANFRSLATEAELVAQLECNPQRTGIPALRSVLAIPGGPQRTRSSGERKLLQLLRAAGVTGFQANARIHGREIDFLWRDLDFGLELDGWDGHKGRIAFERDRLKIAELKARGVDLMPITGRQLRDDPEAVVGRVIAALAVAEARQRRR